MFGSKENGITDETIWQPKQQKHHQNRKYCEKCHLHIFIPVK